MVCCVDNVACRVDALVHVRTYEITSLPIACPLEEVKPCWAAVDWVAGNRANNDVYAVEAGHVLLYGHLFRMRDLPYHLEQKVCCLDAVVFMMSMKIITREYLKWYVRASRHIDPQKLRACVAEMDNICNDLDRPERADIKKRMRLATLGRWNCREFRMWHVPKSTQQSDAPCNTTKKKVMPDGTTKRRSRTDLLDSKACLLLGLIALGNEQVFVARAWGVLHASERMPAGIVGVYVDGVHFRWKLEPQAATVDEDEQLCLDLDAQLVQDLPNTDGSPAHKVGYALTKRNDPDHPRICFAYTAYYDANEKECWVALYKQQLNDGYHLCNNVHAIYVRTVYGKKRLLHGQLSAWCDDPDKQIHWLTGKPQELDEERSHRQPWRTIEEGHNVDPYWECAGKDIQDIDEPRTELNWEARGWNSK